MPETDDLAQTRRHLIRVLVWGGTRVDGDPPLYDIEAIAQVAEKGSQQDLDLLRPLLKDERLTVRSAAAEALRGEGKAVRARKPFSPDG
eukprot:1221467-Amphidinium_carterae.1